MESRVQSTCDDAVRAKAAAVKAGYYHDPFVAAFVHDPHVPVQPIIKRGTFARTACVDRALVGFLKLAEEYFGSQKTPQIVVLGAGKDTSFLRLQAGLIGGDEAITRRCNWFDVDYQTVLSAKREVFRRSENILRAREVGVNARGGVVMEATDGNPVWDGKYHLVPHDLRQDIKELDDALKDCGFVSTAPVLFVFECCLMYLPDAVTKSLLQGLVSSCADPYVFLYEPILGTDPFGRMMESNLTRAGVVDSESTLITSRTLRQHIDNLLHAGFAVAAGCDMWDAFETVLTSAQRQHASRCEFLDELEEWILIMRHYCMVVASAPRSTFGKQFCRVGNDSVMGLVAGRCEEAVGSEKG